VPLSPLIIVNPTAGAGRAARLVPWLRERLGPRPEADLHVTRAPGDAEEVSADAARHGHDRVVAVGGDGTVQEVANGLLREPGDVELGIVPVGTGNDLARSLGLPTDPAEAWKLAMGRVTRPIDAARARNGAGQERWFASVGDISRLTVLRELPNLYRGTHVRNPAVSTHTARTIEIDGVAGTRIHLDGEPFGALPLRVSISPHALSVAVAG